MSNSKMGFWSVFAIVTGSQIGTGILMLPAALSQYGAFSLIGWIISSLGAIALAFVFASLCSKLPKTGGPHVYVEGAFGKSLAFFTGWTYWIISWVSTTAVIVTSISYLSPFIGNQSSSIYLLLEIILLLAITFINLKGVGIAGKIEFIFALLKFIPLLILPLGALYYFNSGNFIIAETIKPMSMSSILGQVTILTVWGFVGVESGTTPAGSVYNPSKTIPRAILFGTLSVALLYMINSIGIMGLIHGESLAKSKAPYVDAAQILFGGQWHLIISIIASIVCIGTLNAWMLTSGQIALGLAEDNLMPKIFAKRNNNGAPMFALSVSCLGILPLLVLTSNSSISEQISSIIEISVISFLFVYLICAIALVKLVLAQKSSYHQLLFSLFAAGFCIFVISQTPVSNLLLASLFTFSGLPVYLFWYRIRKNN